MAGSRTDAETAERRTCEAATLLQQGRSPASVVSELARNWGISERQASRYVAAARRRVSWGVAGDSLAPALHQALSTLQDLAAAAAGAGNYREANKAWATFATLIKTAPRVDAFNVWEIEREALGSSAPEAYPLAPSDDDALPF